MNKLEQCFQWVQSHRDAFIDAVRIYLGVGLMVKGALFLTEQGHLLRLIDDTDIVPASTAVAYTIIGVHIAGGLLLALGLFTRFAALVQVPILFGAAFFVYLPVATSVESAQHFQFTALTCFLCVLLVGFGAGRCSLDKPAKAPRADLFIDLVRIYLGLGLMAKGVFFLSERQYLMDLIDNAGAWSFIPIFAAHYVIPAHLVGGLLLAIGMFTRLAALAQLPILLGAVALVHWSQWGALEGQQDIEFSALVLFLLALHFVFGAGRFSLDRLMARQEAAEAHPAPAHGGIKA